MSSKRGRKRNDSLPPNRARDVQRAFRARRTAHLQALEQRVSELEEENGCLRQALSLPPSNRTPLGKGPTGKDRPRMFELGSSQPLDLSPSGRSSSANSPPSRMSSQSPSTIAVSMRSRPMTVIEPDSWNETMLMGEHQSNQHQTTNIAGPSDPSHPLPLSAPLPLKPLQYSSYDSAFTSTSRRVSNNVYDTNGPISYSPSSDLPMGGSHRLHGFTMQGEIREETSRQAYPYAPAFQGHEPDIRNQTPAPGIHSHSHTQSPPHREPSPYPHRRSLTDPQGFPVGHGYSHLSGSSHLHHNPRPPDNHRHQEDLHLHPTGAARSALYGPDGHMNPLT